MSIHESKRVAIIGAGTMGCGIAHLAAAHGFVSHLIDVNPDQLVRASQSIRKQIDRQVEKSQISAESGDEIFSRLQFHETLDGAFGCGLVIEAIVENLGVKMELLADIEPLVEPQAILATNTSSLSVGAIASCLRIPGRFVGMHFFNPPLVMPLVEIIAGVNTDHACMIQAADIARGWGKTTVLAKDTPGFIVNRVARGYYLEAIRLLAEGVAGIDEIDAIMRTHGGFKMGPFQLMDLVGLDINLAVTTSVWEQMGQPPRMAPHVIQQELVRLGRLGRKTSRGFYSYDDRGSLPTIPVDRKSFVTSPLQTDALRVFSERAGMRDGGTTVQLVFSRILAAILNEAAMALDEGVATADDIDIAMIRGTSYPRGPFDWIRTIGPRTVRGALRALNGACGDGRYSPAQFLIG